MADPLARFVGVGDYTDGVSPSNRKHLMAAYIKGELYDTAQEMMADAARAQVQTFIDIIRPTRGRWDFLLEGHHYYKYQQGRELRTTDQDIAEWLGCPHLGDGEALVTYNFKDDPLHMYATHGQSKSASGSLAAALNQLERQMREHTCHIYLTGHFHTIVTARASKLRPHPKDDWASSDSVLVCGGSWMHSRVKGKTSYAEAGLMVPLAVGAPMIWARKHRGGRFELHTWT